MRYNGFYFFLFKGTMKKVITSHFGKEYAKNIMKKSKKLYKEIVFEAPEMGKGNPMAYNALFAYAFFSPYLASDKKISKEICSEMMEKSLYHVRWFFNRTNLNTLKGKKENKKNIIKYVKWYTPQKEAMYPQSFKVDFVGSPGEDACFYRITRCPICNYAKKLGCFELMSLFCDLDKVMIKLQHGVLNREKTIAGGDDYCDYYIVGNKENA